MGLLDPVLYPGAMKAFAKEICRNDLLNFGRLHFFFPDSRLALDLNTDKTLKVKMPQPASTEQCLLDRETPNMSPPSWVPCNSLSSQGAGAHSRTGKPRSVAVLLQYLLSRAPCFLANFCHLTAAALGRRPGLTATSAET